MAKKAAAKPFGVDMAQLKASENKPSDKPLEPAKVDTFLKFSFQVDSINIKLFTGTMKLKLI